jgi:hypothetical protein
MTPPVDRRRLATGAAIGLAGALLLLFNTAARMSGTQLEPLLVGWRGWDDLAIATGSEAHGLFPVAPYGIGNTIDNRMRRRSEEWGAFRDKIVAAIAAAQTSPVRFWETIDSGPFHQPDPPFLAQRFDDAGRAYLLAGGFRVLGGVAPFLLFWLAALFALPVIVWSAIELAAAGRAVTAGVFVCLLGLSSFVVDALSLAYSGIGFYLVALLTLVPLTTYAITRPAPRGLLWRASLTGLAVALGTLCRNGTQAILPAVAIVLLIGSALVVRRTASASVVKRVALAVGLAAAAFALAVAPISIGRFSMARAEAAAVARLEPVSPARPARHDVWITVWQGLGDFDRTHGHVYLDQAGEERVKKEGVRSRLGGRTEKVMRRAVLRSIESEPSWFAGILAKRVWATVSFAKLAPWGPRDGASIVAATTMNEGVTDNYYKMTDQADWFRLGRHRVEVPVTLVVGPLFLLAVLGLVPERWLPARARDGERQWLVVPVVLSLAALPLPVLITTASAHEMEAFVVVHFMAAALLVDGAYRSIRRGTAAAAIPAPPAP